MLLQPLDAEPDGARIEELLKGGSSAHKNFALRQLGARQLAFLGHWAPMETCLVEGAVDSLLLALQLQLLDDVVGRAEAPAAPALHEGDNCLLLGSCQKRRSSTSVILALDST